MQIADIVIFIAEEYAPSKDMYDTVFNGALTADISKKYSTECRIELFKSDYDHIKVIKEKIGERFQKTQDEGKLYLSVGIFDLVNVRYQKHINGSEGVFGKPNIALWVLKNVVTPLFDLYRFRAVLPTNIYNHFNEMIDDCKMEGNDVFVEEFEALRRKMDELIKTALASEYVVEKEAGIRFGEGIVNPDIIDKIKRKLLELIEQEINHSRSPSSTYKKNT
jgi:hypothetical protein